jgi:hypothetical protein
MIMTGRLSARDYEELARRQASRDYSIELRRGPKRPAANSLSRVEVERSRRALLDAFN